MCFLFQKHFCLSPFIPTATLKKLEPSNFHLQRQEDFKSLAAGGSPSALLLPPQELADLPMLRLLPASPSSFHLALARDVIFFLKSSSPQIVKPQPSTEPRSIPGSYVLLLVPGVAAG